MLTHELQKYIEGVTDRKDVHEWASKTLAKYLESKPMETADVEHVIDYLASDKAPSRVYRMSVPQAIEAAAKWTKALQKKGEHIEEKPEDVETVLDFKDGFRIVKLVGKSAYEREGFLMRHCVASYYGRSVEVYSLRDKDNMPHATMEKDNQIKGKGNGSIHPQYVGYVVKFLEHVGMDVRDSEMANLGYMNVTKWKKHLSKETQDGLFAKMYHYREKPMIGKDGKQLHCLDELDSSPLIEDTRVGIRCNFEIPTFVPLSVKFLLDVCKSKEKTTYGGKRDSQLAVSGDSSQLAASGYYSKLAASGDSSQLAASGNYSKLAASGYYSKLAASGDSSQLAASGDSSQLAASGYYSKLAASGNYSKLAASGNYSQLELNGEHSIGAAIGHKSRIKAKLGCWITLAEYDSNYKPVCVKSAKIDGKNLKENTWYELKNGEFVEASDND